MRDKTCQCADLNMWIYFTTFTIIPHFLLSLAGADFFYITGFSKHPINTAFMFFPYDSFVNTVQANSLNL